MKQLQDFIATYLRILYKMQYIQIISSVKTEKNLCVTMKNMTESPLKIQLTNWSILRNLILSYRRTMSLELYTINLFLWKNGLTELYRVSQFQFEPKFWRRMPIYGVFIHCISLKLTSKIETIISIAIM